MATGISQDQTIDYQHFIDYQLSRAQGRMKSVEVGTAVVRLITAVLVYVLFAVILDHALVLASGVRLTLLLLAFAAALGYIGWAVVRPSWRRISHFYAARTIEQATPEFKNSLMNFLDLRRHSDDLPAGVLAVLEERAVSDLSHVQVDEKINQDRLVQASYGLAAVVLVTCAAVLFNAFVTQRSLAASLGRVLFPTADIQPPTQTRLTEIKPGDKSVVAHTTVTVSAVADGRAPAQVSLYWSDDAGKFWREQPLHKPESGSQFDPWGAQLLVEKPLKYYLVGGDCRTKEFTIDVTDPPMVTSLEVTYDYPDYTGWPKYTTNNGNIDALEGTTVTLTATTNRPVASGQVRFGSNKGAGPAMQSVARRDDQLSAQFSVTKNDSYVIWFVTGDGETNPRPTSYEIKVRVDLPPTVSVKPGIDQVDPPVPANAIIPIGVAARDDFGIDEIKLNIGQGQDTIHSIDLTDAQVAGKELSLTHRLDLERLHLNNGDEITYWVDVADNRQPKRNRVSSPHYRIRLGSPLSPMERDDEEKRQVQLARAEDAERAAQDAQKLDDPAQQSDNQNATPNTENTPDEPAPKDERAFDVMRKYLQEKDRRERLEQPRDGADKEDENRPPSATDSGESGEQGDPSRGKKEPSQSEKNEGERSESTSQAGDKANKDGQGSESQEKGESGRPNDSKRNQQPGGKKGDSSSNDPNSGEKPTPDKSNSGKGSDDAGSKSSASGGEKNGDKNGESTGDRSEKGDADGDKAGGDKQPGDKAGGDKPGGKSGGDKAAADDASGAKPKGDGAADGKGQPEKSDGEAGDRSSGKPEAKGDATKNSEGAGQEATKPRGETMDSGTGSDNAQDSKTQGKTTGSKGQKPNGEKANGQDGKGDAGNKEDSGGDEAGGDKAGGDKAGGDKAGGDKSGGDKAGGDKAGGDKSGGDKSGGDKSGGDKSGGDKSGGDKSGGDKSGGDKSGGDKSGGDKSGGDKSGGDKSGGDKSGGDKSGGDKSGGDKSGGDKSGGDKSGGDKSGGDKSGGDKSGGDKSGGDKSGGDKGGGDKSGGDKSGGDKSGGDKSGGDKSGGDKSGGDKSGGDKSGGDKSGGDKSGGDKGGGDKAGGGDKSDGDSQENSGSNDPKGGSQDSPGKSGNAQPGAKGAPTGKGAGSSGGGSNSSGERTENAQPGGGENPGQGPIRKNDAASGESPPTRKASTPDYSNEGSELVLDRVAKQLDKGDIDPELLKRLGWTRDELEQFVKEFQGPGATDTNQQGAPGKSATPKKKTDDAKTTLDDKKIRSTRRGPGQTAQDAIGENYEGRRSKPAPEYEDHVRAYNMSQSKGETSSQAPPKRD